MEPMPAIAKLLTDYLDYLEIERNRSVKTRANYERYLRAFFAYGKIGSERDITEGAVRAFRLHLARVAGREGSGLSKRTQTYYAIALRNFLKYLAKQGVAAVGPEFIELPRIAARQIETPEYEDMERILAAPHGNSLASLRDRALLELLFSTGLRVAELCSLDRDVDVRRGEVTVRGKGGKLRVVFVSGRAQRALAGYLRERSDSENSLFVSISPKGRVLGRIQPRTVQRLIDRYARRAGVVKRVTPHTFRHFFATDLLINGADLRSVQELLGHSSITTTQVYTHLTNRELREVHRAFHGRRRT